MKKAEFIHKVAAEVGFSKKDTAAFVEASLAVITKTLQSGQNINFIGFGAFSTTVRAARKAKVPKTDRIVDVPETISVKFKAGKNLKDAVAEVKNLIKKSKSKP